MVFSYDTCKLTVKAEELSSSPAVRLQAPIWGLAAIAWLLSSKFRFAVIVTVMLLCSHYANGMGVYDNCKLMDGSTQYKLYWSVRWGE